MAPYTISNDINTIDPKSSFKVEETESLIWESLNEVFQVQVKLFEDGILSCRFRRWNKRRDDKMEALDSPSLFHEIFEHCQKFSRAQSFSDAIATNYKYRDLILPHIFQTYGILVDHFRNFRTHFLTWFGIDMNRKPGIHFFKSRNMSYDIIEMIYKDVIREKNMQQNQVKIVVF